MADKNLTCRDCGSDFVFSEREQEFYQEKGFENEPTRCADCRAAKKQQRKNGGFRGGNNRSNGGSRSGNNGNRSNSDNRGRNNGNRSNGNRY